ncbi:MAG: A24 family peptidase [Alicyclobacillus sp.]|nr:A24 family peptidase [Alicyclobacillus sp.]
MRAIGAWVWLFGLIGFGVGGLAAWLGKRLSDGDGRTDSRGLWCVPLISAALFGATVLRVQALVQLCPWLTLWFLLLVVTVTDIRSMRVPNLCTYAGAGCLLLATGCCHLHSWVGALTGAGTAAVVMVGLHVLSRGQLGMGDVKLFVSVGTVLGPVGAMAALFFASVSGAVTGLALRWMGLQRRMEPMPFVPHIAVGSVIVAFFGPALADWYVVHWLPR